MAYQLPVALITLLVIHSACSATVPPTKELEASLEQWNSYYADPPELGPAELDRAISVAREQQDAHLLYLLHEVTLRGPLVLRDPPLAKILIEEAVALGSVEAKATLGARLLHGEPPFDVPGGPARGKLLLDEAAQTDHPKALLYVGIAIFSGLPGYQEDIERARDALEQALLKGSLRAHFYLSYILWEQGDREAARRHLEIGVRAGDPQAKNALANWLLDSGEEHDLTRAVRLAREAAQSGTPKFQYEYGLILATKAPENIPVDLDLMLARASEAGLMDAVYLRGYLHVRQMLPASDVELGWRLIDQAAAAGHRKAALLRETRLGGS